MRKKLLAALLTSAMLAATLTGCGGSADSAPADSSANTETDAAADTAEGAEDEAADVAAEPAADAAEGTETGTDAIVSAPTELTYIFADGDEGAKASMNEIVNKFNETYPDITVTIEPGNGGAYSEFIKTKDSVGECPVCREWRF